MSDATGPDALKNLALDFGESPRERFRVEGATLAVTDRFDPRYQPRAETELLRILHGLMEDADSPEIVLDLSECLALPSMMIACIHQAERDVAAAGRELRIRMRADHYRRYGQYRLLDNFSAAPAAREEGGGGVERLDLKPRKPNGQA